jgi:alkylation response protein AidB-like acyl-CoA dehydrogenase
MDFDLPGEIQILRNTVRKFVDKELIPLERVYRHDSEGPMPEHLLKPLQQTAKAMGLWMLDVPCRVRRRWARFTAALYYSRGDRAGGFPPVSQPRALWSRGSPGAVPLQ